jgi:hypothetical protein
MGIEGLHDPNIISSWAEFDYMGKYGAPNTNYFFRLRSDGTLIAEDAYGHEVFRRRVASTRGSEPQSRPVIDPEPPKPKAPPARDPDAGNPNHMLWVKSRGKLVQELKRLLNAWPEPKASLDPANDVFDEATKAAVIAFQKAQSPPLVPENLLGTVEAKTWKKLRTLYGRGVPGGGPPSGAGGPGTSLGRAFPPPDQPPTHFSSDNENSLLKPGPALDPEITPNILERLRKEIEWAALLGRQIHVVDVAQMSYLEKLKWVLHYTGEFLGAAIVDEAEGLIRSLGHMAGGVYHEVMKHPELLVPGMVPVYVAGKLVENQAAIRKRLAASRLFQTLLKPDVLIAMAVNPAAGLSLMVGHLAADFMKEIDRAKTGQELVRLSAKLAHIIGNLYVQLLLAILTEGVATAASEVIGGVRAAKGLAEGMEALETAEVEEAAAVSSRPLRTFEPPTVREVPGGGSADTIPETAEAPTVRNPPEGPEPATVRNPPPEPEPTTIRDVPAEETPPETVRSRQSPDKSDAQIQDRYGKYISEEKKLNNATSNTKLQPPDKFKEGVWDRKLPGETAEDLEGVQGEMVREKGPDGKYTGKRTSYLDGGLDEGVLEHVKRHEYNHFYSDNAFIKEFSAVDVGAPKPVNFNEGVTEYFAREAGGVKGPPTAYPDEVRLAEQVAKEVGEDTLAKAYFQGDKDAMDQVRKALKKLGEEPPPTVR